MVRIGREKVKDLIIGTPFEPFARRAAKWHYVHLSLSKDAREHRQIRAVIKRVLSENSNCVDVGSYTGEILRPICKFAPHGTHYAFEPIPELYQDLVRSFPAVHVHQMALSDKLGITTFQHVLSAPAYSGLRRRKYELHPNKDIVVKQIEVRQDTLDNVIRGEVPIHFIKIDVEGAELSVLKGAVRTIQDNKPIIIFEHELGSIEYYETKPDEVYRFLSDCGLRVSLMASWLRGEQPLDLHNFVKHVEQGTNINFIAYP
jgi:FkbM family methyltransferase